MASSFHRQLKFAQALIDSFGRLTAEAVLRGDIDFAMSLFIYTKKVFREVYNTQGSKFLSKLALKDYGG